MLLLQLIISCKDKHELPQNVDEFVAFLEDEMYIDRVPAMGVILYKEDQILHQSYLGKSNLEQNVPLESNHVFLLASISKVVTATALLQLFEDGYFELDDDVNDYLPFRVEIPNYPGEITFRMLLTHTSGIDDGAVIDDHYYYGMDSPIELDYFIENYLVPGGIYYNANQNFHRFAPGTEYSYSNEGNTLIGVLVQYISGIDFNEYCKQNIFDPLEMNNTFWKLSEVDQPKVIPYEYRRNELDAIEHYTFTDYPNGGLRSTPENMFRLLSALTMNGVYQDIEILESSTVLEMLTPQIPDLDDEVGLHMFLMNKGLNLWGHDGGEQGVSTIMAFNPDTKVGVIVFTNNGDAYLDLILSCGYEFALTL